MRGQKAAALSCVCLLLFLLTQLHCFLVGVCVFVDVALQVVFGSLYRDDVLIKPSRVVSILAAACMLQLVGIMNEVTYCLKCHISMLIFVRAVI